MATQSHHDRDDVTPTRLQMHEPRHSTHSIESEVGRQAEQYDDTPGTTYQEVNGATYESLNGGQVQGQLVEESSKWRAFLDDTWLYEIVSISYSLCFIASIGVILAMVNGKPLSSWAIPIQPNAVIAILSAAAKASLIYPVSTCIGQLKWLHLMPTPRRVTDLQTFDDASRGPWGSTVFVARIGATRAVIAGLCSVVTILALAMDPFTQQIIEFRTRTISIGPASASTWAAQGYNTRRTSAILSLESGMRGAILMGMYGKPSDSPFSCVTGNCTYQDVHTLGIYTTCMPATAAFACDDSRSPVRKNCTFTTPGGHQLTAEWSSGAHTIAFTQMSTAATKHDGFSFGRGAWDGMTDGGWTHDPQNAVNASTLIWLSVLNNTDTNVWPNSTIYENAAISECSIELCERSYLNFTVVNGRPNSSTVVNTKLRAMHTIPDENTLKLAAIFRPDMQGAENPTYQVSLVDYASLATSLESLFSGSLTSYVEGAGNTPSYYDDFAGVSEGVHGVPEAIYRAPSPSILLGNIADRMTDYMRGDPAASSTVVAGEATRDEPEIHVRWLWFILPAGLSFSGALLLALTIVANWRRGGRLWKSSLLPGLFHPLHDGGSGIRSEAAQAERLHKMNDLARRTEARLGEDEQGGVRLLASYHHKK